ncbi:MAG TPA: hypothetical protein VJ476_01470 [Rhizomicrobium sp.]|nr:hypothetical protein [Rhizomicrobium sp.]
MVRVILGGLIGAVVWLAVITGMSFALREVSPALAAALNAHTTVIALWGRLAISFLGSLLGGLVAALVSNESTRAPLGAGVVLLLLFVPYHLFGRDAGGPIWTHYPLWYHLTFFASLVLLSVLGGRLRRA